MTENAKTYLGHIKWVNYERNFGFVETENEEFFFLHSINTKDEPSIMQGHLNMIHIFCPGDEVEFKLRASQKYDNKIEAYDLIFIKNERRERLIKEANQTDNLVGYIKLIDNKKLYVHHKSTAVLIPLKISGWETDLDEIYTNRINKPVTFKLTQTQKIDKLKAVLNDIKMSDEYYIIKSAFENSSVLQASIKSKSAKGLLVTILNGKIEGFISVPKNLNDIDSLIFKELIKGSIINVRITRIFDSKWLSFTFVHDEKYLTTNSI